MGIMGLMKCEVEEGEARCAVLISEQSLGDSRRRGGEWASWSQGLEGPQSR